MHGRLPKYVRSVGEALEANQVGLVSSVHPLGQVLDIGGAAVQPSFKDDGNTEVPPIPCHVHAGTVVDGRVQGPGKLEAYFFPPVDVEPYNLEYVPAACALPPVEATAPLTPVAQT